MILFKKQLFDLEVKGQGPTKVMTVRYTPPYGHAPTYQISLTYLERQKSYDKKILFWWESVTAGHNFGRGSSNDYSIKAWF
jgi:hypothetical protein